MTAYAMRQQKSVHWWGFCNTISTTGAILTHCHLQCMHCCPATQLVSGRVDDIARVLLVEYSDLSFTKSYIIVVLLCCDISYVNVFIGKVELWQA